MTFLIKLEDGQPVGYPIVEGNFFMLFPNTSFPRLLTPEIVEPLGYGLWDFSNKPDVLWNQKLVEVAPVKDQYGSWRQTWQVINLSGEELQQAQQKEQERIRNEIIFSTQKRLDLFARTRNYDGILSACSYVNSTNLKFKAEGEYCVSARDATWQKLYDILAEVEAGTRPVPTGFSDIESELPLLQWP